MEVTVGQKLLGTKCRWVRVKNKVAKSSRSFMAPVGDPFLSG